MTSLYDRPLAEDKPQARTISQELTHCRGAWCIHDLPTDSPEETDMPASGFTRREFTLALAGGAALAADHQSPVLGQEAAEPKPATKPAQTSESTTTEKGNEAAPAEPPPEAAYLLGLILRRYPDERLDETAITGIVQDIHGDLARSRVLSSFPLDNSDEPGFTFKAWRAG